MMRRCFFLFLVCITGSLAFLTQTKADTVELPLTDPGQNYSEGSLRISNGASSVIVTGSDSPFGSEEATRALHVRNNVDEEPSFRLRVRLWNGEESVPLKGVVEASLWLVRGSVQLHVGANAEPVTNHSVDITAIRPDQVHCRVTLTPGKPLLVIFGHKLKKIAEDEVFITEGLAKIKMEWDYTSDGAPFFMLSINDKPLLSAEDASVRWVPTPEMTAQGGINILSLLSIKGEGISDYFIGPISFLSL